MDRISGGVVLFLAATILWQARVLPFGNISAPGPGFFPTVIAVILIVLASFLIISGDSKKEEKPWAEKGRVFLVFFYLMVYFFFIETLGFMLISVLFMTALFVTVTQQKWYRALFWAFVSTGIAYLLFEVLLSSNLPKGVWGF